MCPAQSLTAETHRAYTPALRERVNHFLCPNPDVIEVKWLDWHQLKPCGEGESVQSQKEDDRATPADRGLYRQIADGYQSVYKGL